MLRDLDLTVTLQFVVPQDDFLVLFSSSQQHAAPHPTHTENTSLVTIDMMKYPKGCVDRHTHTHTKVSYQTKK